MKEVNNDDFNPVEGIKIEVEIKINDESDDIGKNEEENENMDEDVKGVDINEVGFSSIVELGKDFDGNIEMIVVLIVVVINSKFCEEVKEIVSFSFSNNVVKEI